MIKNKRTKSKYLHDAVKCGSLGAVKFIISNGVSVNALNKLGNTSLHIAVQEGNLEMVRLLLEHGANINALNKSRDAPLHTAVQKGSPEIIRFLLEHGANVNLLDRNGDTLLHLAVRGRNLRVVEILLSYGLDVNVMNKQEMASLILVLQKEYDKLNPHFKEHDELDLRFEEKDLEMVSLLLRYGANLNIANSLGLSPLYIATAKRDARMVEILLKNGANPNLAVPMYRSCIASSIMGKDSETTILLLRHGADFNSVVSRGRIKPLHQAVDNEDLEVVQFLLNNGAEVNSTAMFNKTPLHFAAKNKDLEIAELLLNNRANVTVDRGEAECPLQLSIGLQYQKNDNVEIVESLLRKKANFYARDDGSNAIGPLHYACIKGNWPAFFLLLTFDVDFREGEREQVNSSASFSAYLSAFEKIKKEACVNDFLKIYVNENKIEEFQNQKGNLISKISKARKRYNKDSEGFLVFDYIYHLIASIEEKCVIIFQSHGPVRKSAAARAFAAIIDANISMERGYFEDEVKKWESSMASVCRDIGKDIIDHSETKAYEAVSNLLEASNVDNVCDKISNIYF